MKTITIWLSRHAGTSSYAGSYSPQAETPADPTETTYCFYASDDDRTYDVPKWSQATVDVPDWMTSEFFCQYDHKLTYMWAQHSKAIELDEHIVRKLMHMNDDDRRSLAYFLSTNPRGEFKQSLKAQALAWFEQETAHRLPLSPKQMSYIDGRPSYTIPGVKMTVRPPWKPIIKTAAS